MSAEPLTLFAAAPIVGRDDPETSKIAAERHAPTGKLSALQTRIMDAFHTQAYDADRGSIPAPGFNPSELTAYLNRDAEPDMGLDLRTVEGRMRQLRGAGHLMNVGSKEDGYLTRPSAQGCQSRVFRIGPVPVPHA